jgi:hypothetical protein
MYIYCYSLILRDDAEFDALAAPMITGTHWLPVGDETRIQIISRVKASEEPQHLSALHSTALLERTSLLAHHSIA